MRIQLLLIGLFMVGCAHKDLLSTYKLKEVPLTPAHWKVVYDGGGKVLFNPDATGDMVFSPQQARSPRRTYATLLLLKDTMVLPMKDYIARVDLTTTRQLRVSTPNDWEVFWFFGNYRQEKGLSKEANYVIVKPQSGVEIGRAFDEVGQHFLWTSPETTSSVGERFTLTVLKKGPQLKVFKNGNVVVSYESGQMPRALYDLPGTLGLYSEDAEVRIHSFAYQAL